MGIHDQTGEALELLAQLKLYVPTKGSVDTAFRIVQARAVITHAEISIRSAEKMIKDAERKGVEDLQKSFERKHP